MGLFTGSSILSMIEIVTCALSYACKRIKSRYCKNI